MVGHWAGKTLSDSHREAIARANVMRQTLPPERMAEIDATIIVLHATHSKTALCEVLGISSPRLNRQLVKLGITPILDRSAGALARWKDHIKVAKAPRVWVPKAARDPKERIPRPERLVSRPNKKKEIRKGPDVSEEEMIRAWIEKNGVNRIPVLPQSGP